MAAANYAAEVIITPPFELELYWQFKQWGAGDILALPAGLLQRVTNCGNVYEAFKLWHGRELGHDGQWKQQHPNAWKIIKQVRELMNGSPTDHS